MPLFLQGVLSDTKILPPNQTNQKSARPTVPSQGRLSITSQLRCTVVPYTNLGTFGALRVSGWRAAALLSTVSLSVTPNETEGWW